MVMPLLNLGSLYYAMDKPAEALAYFNESLALSCEVGESDWARALTWHYIGEVYLYLDEPARTIEVVEPSYRRFAEKGDTYGVATCAFTLGRALGRRGATEAADMRLAEAERLFGALGNLVLVARIRCVRASLALERADLDAAQRDLAQALDDLASQARARATVWRVVERVATLLSLRGELALAARLSAAALARHAVAPEPLEPAERDLRARDLARLRAALPAPTLAACLAEGQALPPDEAIALARAAVQRWEG